MNIFPKNKKIQYFVIVPTFVIGAMAAVLTITDFNDKFNPLSYFNSKEIQPNALWKTKKINFSARTDYKNKKYLLGLETNKTLFFIEGSDNFYGEKEFRKFKFKYTYLGKDYEYKTYFLDPKSKRTSETKNEFSLFDNSYYGINNEYLLKANNPTHYIFIRLISLDKNYSINSLEIKYLDYIGHSKIDVMEASKDGVNSMKPVFINND